jgi:predicted lactoylglutathione lyase
MAKMIFLNLPVTDLAKSTAFYEAVGATKNPQFSDETASCMVFSETIHAMLLTHDKYRMFTENRADVDSMADQASKAGGASDPNPKQDHGFMYGRSFEDPDGHVWEVIWMAGPPPA